jgi:hypothetical protein
MSHPERARIATALLACAAISSAVLGAQQAVPPQAAPQPPASSAPSPAATRLPSMAPAQPAAMPPAARRAVAPQGVSVVLVLGDLQGASAADDVPLAARKALTDMRDFLPFKSYKLLDAAWLMCCGEQRPLGAMDRRPASENVANTASQMLRGPDEQEYELRLSTSRGDNARVFVRFTLVGSSLSSDDTPASAAASMRTTQRRIADLQDRAQLLQSQIAEAKRRVEVGVASASEVNRMEVELRSLVREIDDLKARAASGVATRSAQRGPVSERASRGSVIDTSFSMDVGETVVVGTSRLKGGTKALIALLTAVPPRR